MTHILERFHDGGVLFDGAMGTMLIAKGLRLGKPPEEWNCQHPEILLEIHLSYLKAGAEAITTNTFGGTPSRLKGFGLGVRIGEINTTGVQLARRAVSEFESIPAGRAETGQTDRDGSLQRRARFVALSVGPSGKMFPPVGSVDQDELRDEFTRQFDAIDSGYDLVVIETMYDLREALIALDVAKKSTATPVAVTLTFTRNPRGFFTIMGDEAACAMRTLEEARADIVGANCSITSAEMIDLGRTLRQNTELPVLCQPNAGKPRVKDGVPLYDQAPEDFARDALVLFEMGINAVGGCCGTTPAFIEAIRTAAPKH